MARLGEAERATVAYVFYYRTLNMSYRLMQNMLFVPSPVAGATGLVDIYWNTFERDIRQLALDGYLEPLHDKSSPEKGVFRVREEFLQRHSIPAECVEAPFYPNCRKTIARLLSPAFLAVLRWKPSYQKPRRIYEEKPRPKVVA